MRQRQIVDLSHPIEPSIPMFPGLPAPEIEAYLSREASLAHYAGGTSFLIHRYHLIGNTGTYMDGPFHRHPDAADLATLPLAKTVDLSGLVLDVSVRVAAGERAIDVIDLGQIPVAGCALLIQTGWDMRWPGPEYLDLNPFLTAAAAADLVRRRVALVGIDTWNVDDTQDGTRPVHTQLLRAEIPIVENLRGLAQLPARGFRFSAAPLPIRAGSAVSVRAYAVLDAG